MLVAALPLWLTPVPPLGDIYFHVARMRLILAADDPVLGRFYEPAWGPIPNLAMDLVVPALAHAVGIEQATRLFLLLAFALITSGAIALHRVLFRVWSWWPLAAGLFLYGWVTAIGFVNYLFAIGPLLWALAAWFGLCRYPRRRFAAGALLALVLYACHFYALAYYGFVIGTAELGAWRRNGVPAPRVLAVRLLAIAGQFVLPFALLFAAHTTSAGAPVTWTWSTKALMPAALFLTGNLPIDIAFFLIVAAMAWTLIWNGALRTAVELRLPLLLTCVLGILIPSGMAGLFYADTRLPAAAIFVALAATWPRLPRKRDRAALGGALVLAFVVRMVGVYADFGAAGPEIAAILGAYRRIPPGSLLLATSVAPTPWNGFLDRPGAWGPPWNRREAVGLGEIETLAVLESPVFVPVTLLDPGKQPVAMRPAYRRLKRLQRNGDTPTWFAAPTAIGPWLDDEVHPALASGNYRFPAVFVGINDPQDRARPPTGVSELFHGYGYRLWDVSARVLSRQ